MVKKQQMQWSERGAHLLLQVQAAVLNGDLRERPHVQAAETSPSIADRVAVRADTAAAQDGLTIPANLSVPSHFKMVPDIVITIRHRLLDVDIGIVFCPIKARTQPDLSATRCLQKVMIHASTLRFRSFSISMKLSDRPQLVTTGAMADG
jgi:hypothetical protein